MIATAAGNDLSSILEQEQSSWRSHLASIEREDDETVDRERSQQVWESTYAAWRTDFDALTTFAPVSEWQLSRLMARIDERAQLNVIDVDVLLSAVVALVRRFTDRGQQPVRTEDRVNVTTISDALDGLLTAMIEGRDRIRRSHLGKATPLEIKTFAQIMEEGLPTREQSEVKQLARNPLEYACRQAIRRCGKTLHRQNGINVMEQIAEEVAARDSSQYGARASILDHAWDGIGGEWWC